MRTSDFILEFEERNDPALNSGVQIRSHRYGADAKVMTNDGKRIQERTHPKSRVHGYQVEISSEKFAGSGGIQDEACRGWLHNLSSGPKASKAFRDVQWNKKPEAATSIRGKVHAGGYLASGVLSLVCQLLFRAMAVPAGTRRTGEE